MPTKTTKKAATKRVAKKPAVKAIKPVVKEIPLPDPYCHCTKRKRNCILTCVSLGCFLLGFLVAQLFCFCGCNHHKRMPKIQFTNGCVDVASIKCPKMLEKLPAMDKDNDGCITKAELRAAKKHMRHHEKPVAEPDVNIDDAIAPVME